MSQMIAQFRHVIIRNPECVLETLVPERKRHTWNQLFSTLPCMSRQRGPSPTTEEREGHA